MNPIYTWLVWVLVNIVIFAVISYFRHKYDLLPVDQIAVIAILLSVDMLFIIYSLIFDPTKCVGLPIACFVNQNQGILAFGVLLVGAATIYVDARLKQAEERRLEIRRETEAYRKLQAAVDELVHNLYHFAHQLDDNYKLISFPATTFEATFALLEGETLSYFAPRLSTRLSTLHRILSHNRAVLESSAELTPSLRALSLLDREGALRISVPDILDLLQLPNGSISTLPSKTAVSAEPAENSGESDSVLDLVSFDERIITHSARFFMEAAIFQGKRNHLEFPVPLQKMIDSFQMEFEQTGSYWYYSKSSDVNDDVAAKLRVSDSRLYCWIKDKDVEGVNVVSVRTIIRDIHHTPH